MENPSKDRLLAGSYLHRVYVENVEAFCKDIKPSEGTVFGGVVRPLGELPEDLMRWAEEISKFMTIPKTLRLI